MPIGLNSLELNAWYKLPELAFGKSIQPNWRFYVSFFDNPLKRTKEPGPMPVIRSYHVLDVNIPTYGFEKIVMMYGQVPRSFPVMKFEGFDITLTLEEDELGSIEYFINWCQRSIIDRGGYYNNPTSYKIQALVIEVQDKNGLPIVYYIGHDVYFLEASPVTYSYESNESIKRTMTFGVDRMSTYFTKYTGIAAAQKGLSSVVGKFI